MEKISVIYTGSVNDIYICRDRDGPGKTWYVMWLVRKRSTAGFLAGIPSLTARGTCPDREGIGWIFPYRESRPAMTFYQGRMYSSKERREIFQNCVHCCMASHLPYPILFLILGQRQVNLEQDKSIWFSWCLDLEELDPGKTEADCTAACAGLILEWMGQTPKEDQTGRTLLSRKLERGIYGSLIELSLDLKQGEDMPTKTAVCTAFPTLGETKERRLARILFTLAVALLILSGVFLLSRMVFGDIPFLRLFGKGLEQIGNQSLMK